MESKTAEELFDERTGNGILGLMHKGVIVPLMQEFAAQQNKELLDSNRRLREALEEIARGEGEYSMDRLEHAENVINNLVSIAKQTLNEKP